jgi:hypothetical protein
MFKTNSQEAKDVTPRAARVDRWAVVFGILTLVAYSMDWKAIALLCLTVSAVGATVSLIRSKLSVVADLHSAKLENESPEEFYLNLSDHSDETAWHIFTLMPAKAIFIEEVCYGGPPTNISTFEYQLRGDLVFCRLRDVEVDGVYGIRYEVVNGQILERELKEHSASDSTALHIELLKKGTLWHELSGSIRFFILSKHGYGPSHFLREKERVRKGFADLASAVEKLGGVRKPGNWNWYRASEDADEETESAIAELQKPSNMERFGISFGELMEYEHVMETLDKIVAP